MDTEESLARGRKRIIIGSIVAIVIVVLIIIANAVVPKWAFNYKYKYLFSVNAKKAIEEILQMTLPITAEIVNYDYNKEVFEYSAKIKLEEDSISNIKSELLEFIGKEVEKSKYDESFMLYPYSDWWNLKLDNVQNYYYTSRYSKEMIGGCSSHKVYCRAIITKEGNDNYLYLHGSSLIPAQ